MERLALLDIHKVMVGSDDNKISGFNHGNMLGQIVFNQLGLPAGMSAGGNRQHEVSVAADGGRGEIALRPMAVNTAAQDAVFVPDLTKALEQATLCDTIFIIGGASIYQLAIDLDVVLGAPRAADVDVVLSNSFGFGGHNGSVIFRRYDASTK